MSSTEVKKLVKAKLAESGLDERDAKRLGIAVLSPKETRAALPHVKDVPELSSLRIDYHKADGTKRDGIYRVRVLGEPKVKGFDQAAKPRRYFQPLDTPPAAYFPRVVNWEKVLEDPEVRIVLTEGELKAACACKNGVPTVGLGGVDSWASKKRGLSLLPELERVKWNGRNVVICYDSDAAKNPGVASATHRLAATLLDRGAIPAIAHLPDVAGLKKTGIDDYIVNVGIEHFEEVIDEATSEEITRKLWEFNSKFIFIKHPGFIYDESAFAPEGVEARFAPPRGQCRMDPSDFKNSKYSNVWARKVVGAKEDGSLKTQDVQVAKEWVDWPHRREAVHITYIPGKPKIVGDAYNAWSGWGVEPQPGSVAPWSKLLDSLCAGSPEMRTWFERWAAWPIAHPDRCKLNSAVCFWSVTKGIGKSVIGKTLGAVYGRENYSEISQKELDSDFNTFMVNKQFVMVDEMTASEAVAKADVLKKYVTQDWLQCNEKHVPLYSIPDTVNFYMTSNRPNAIKVEEGDRRFGIHEVLQSPCGEMHMLPGGCKKCDAFWDEYYSWLRGDGPARLMHHFLNLDFGGFEPSAPAPMTTAKEEMIAASKNEAAQWVARLRDDPQSVLWGAQGPTARDLYTASELLTLFDRERKGQPITANTMGSIVKEHGMPRASTSPLRVNGELGKYYVVRNVPKWIRASRTAMEEHVEAEMKKESGVDEVKPKQKKAKKY